MAGTTAAEKAASEGRTGGCLCGAVRFTLRDRPDHFGVCHCEMCRRWAGSALFAFTVPEDGITVEGSANIGCFQSSDWASRSFCTLCGSGLWYRYDAQGTGGGDYEVSLGLLDDPAGLRLAREIFIDVKPDSFEIAGAHKRLTRDEVMALYAPKAERP